MWKRVKNLAALTVIGLALTGCGEDSGFEFSVPKSKIQEALNGWLPVSSSTSEASDARASVTLKKATVILREGEDRIGFELAIQVDLPKTPLAGSNQKGPLPRLGPPPVPGLADKESPDGSIEGTVIVFVGVRYDAAEGAFYCERPVTEKIDLGKLPEKLSPVVARLSEKLMAEYFAKNSVYKLGDETTTNRLAKSTLKKVVVRDGELIVTLGI
jgi:hypothetical protein